MSGLSNLKSIGPEFYGCHSVVNHYQCNDGIITGSYSGAVTTATEKAMAVVFPVLRELHLEDMPNIEEWCGLGVSSSSSDTTMFFPLLEFVHISGCTELTTIPGKFLEELKYFPWPSTTVSAASASPSASATATVEKEVDDDDTKYHPYPKHYLFIFLVSLTLFGWERLKYLPDQLQHLTTLRDFSLQHFCGLEALPEWLANLLSFHSLELFDCKNLMYLPTMKAMQHFTNLQSLQIYSCPLLKERCAREGGQEWHKIAHIPSINIE
ncbi:putative disease resistance protein RGA3 [Camellia lanceoleosa]|uniref:Disease resistance protein RGA3 n=1 Tax=Camellia lanceoleosa TaxID=1840588 RepID=A0ACC0HCA8_9ERIC|nr:putative disease resistance protein RGA3 [Camellia lanceoleosa]